jgi:thiamine-monophosphate kinase
VAGALGDARAGLDQLSHPPPSERLSRRLIGAFKKPVPRLDVADLLRRDVSTRRDRTVHGAIDVSDGLSSDVIHMCEAGGGGCEIFADRLPISSALARYCDDRGVEAVEFALAGGEDYALILAVDAKKAEDVAGRIRKALAIPAAVIGRFTRRPGTYHLLEPDGSRRAFKPAGWDHLAPGG